MSLPDIIGPISPNGDDMNGIIYHIRQIIPNPISSGIIQVSSCETHNGNANDMVLCSESIYWQSKSIAGSFIQFDFINRFLKPTHYSLRGWENSCYAKRWKIFGFNSGEETDNSKWFLLGENTSVGSNFCGGSTYCGSNNIGTFSVRVSDIGFRYFRLITEEPSCSGSYHMSMRGIDLFGTLSRQQCIF